ncbi:MAG TPA: cell division protein ZipA C-terminal FtsZ-binding domain-containing protein [Methylophilaceae bacterium]|jgi:FtsZ-interacting cell division protein ZipA
MSDLQLSLIALGVAIIAAVMLFNWWQERQLSNKAADLNVVEHDALLVDDSEINQFDEPNLDEEVVVTTRRTAGLADDHDISSEIAGLHDVQDEPTFEVNHQTDQFDNEPTLDQSSTVWEQLSGQDASNLPAEAEFKEPGHADSDLDEIIESPPDETDLAHANLAETSEARVVESEIVTTKAPVTVELTEEELDILNSVPVAPPSFLAQNSSGSPLDSVSSDDLSMPPAQESIVDTAISHNHESTITLRHDGLPAQIIAEIDFAGLIVFSEPTSGSVLAELNSELSALGKPIQAFGLTADNTWSSFVKDHAEGTYVKVAYAIQLADRSGPTSKITLHKFQSAIEANAKKIGAQVEWHGQTDPSSYAVDLDGFCVQVDQLIRFHLIQGASGPFTGTKFRGLAESSGLTLGENGAFHYKNDHGQILFSIINADNNAFNAEMLRNIGLRSVNFELDIPRVTNSTEAFNLMMMAAKKMEASLFAQLVDDNQRALSDVHLEKIRQQLRGINALMVSRGIMPGSPCALRLFS